MKQIINFATKIFEHAYIINVFRYNNSDVLCSKRTQSATYSLLLSGFYSSYKHYKLRFNGRRIADKTT